MHRLRALFFDKKFLHYTWIAVVVSLLNILLLWLLIDIFFVPTVLAGFIVMGVTFILRYVLYSFSQVL